MVSHLGGYYADGYFDRRITARGKTINSRVSDATDPNPLACIGRLFFNPATKASLFFPAAGCSSSSPGILYISETGVYWTSSTCNMNSGLVWGVEFREKLAKHSAVSANFGYNIRCVKDE